MSKFMSKKFINILVIKQAAHSVFSNWACSVPIWRMALTTFSFATAKFLSCSLVTMTTLNVHCKKTDYFRWKMQNLSQALKH